MVCVWNNGHYQTTVAFTNVTANNMSTPLLCSALLCLDQEHHPPASAPACQVPTNSLSCCQLLAVACVCLFLCTVYHPVPTHAHHLLPLPPRTILHLSPSQARNFNCPFTKSHNIIPFIPLIYLAAFKLNQIPLLVVVSYLFCLLTCPCAHLMIIVQFFYPKLLLCLKSYSKLKISKCL